MPIYEYECTKCGGVVEALQKCSDRPLRTCKQCSGKLQKLVSHSTFHLKGSGWYATDYADKSKSSSSSSANKGKESTDTESASKKKKEGPSDST